jgi:hypothetical protein
MTVSDDGHGLPLGHVGIQIRNLIILAAELIDGIKFAENRFDFLD